MKRTSLVRKTPLRAKPPARPVRERAPLHLPAKRTAPQAAVMALVSQMPAPAHPKDGRYISETWRRNVAALPCVACGLEGMTQAAHPNHIGKGMAMKAPDCWSVPLCVDCHREFDQGTRYTKAERREVMNDWIIQTIRELAVRSLVRP